MLGEPPRSPYDINFRLFGIPVRVHPLFWLVGLPAQIAGTNMAIRKLAAKIYEDRDWDVEALTPVLDQLAPLMARKDGLKLICECIPESRRGALGELESGSDLISDLGSKIAQARSDLAEGRFQGTPSQRRAQLEQLDRLSRRLASLVFND